MGKTIIGWRRSFLRTQKIEMIRLIEPRLTMTLTGPQRRTGDLFLSGTVISPLSQIICFPVGTVYPLSQA